MSDDLIRRKALMDAIKKWLPKDPCGQEQSIEEEVATELSVSMLMEIEEAPTAYDVDAVCEKIQRVPHGYLNCETEEQILEIVRNGGKKE